VLPVIDLTDAAAAADAIDRACRKVGFFTVVGHGVDPQLLDDLDAAARRFFAGPDAGKVPYAMATGGKAWRGWFPLRGELTSGVPDHKEGIYFGTEGDADDPRPLHGPNRFPPGLAAPVLNWMNAMSELGLRLLGLLAGHVDFPPGLLDDPVRLFRIFHYPAVPATDDGWGVAEHTDYGLLTILAQDGTGGLEVRRADGEWIGVPPDRHAFVCNIGDMLERMTGGRYRSTPHRVRNAGPADRLSFPFFMDPSWDAALEPLLGDAATGPDRWDGEDPLAFDGTYGDYLTAKVQRVFPELWASEVAPAER
jgi:isopenicillin N synthase-like dioxygenase